jgi:hypothetical protein
MIYRPTEDEAHAALAVARRRNRLNGGQTNLPGGETADETERLRQHFHACLAEIAVSRVMNRAWTGCGKGAHGLRDVAGWWEVRSITDRSRGLLIRKKDDPNAVFVLVYVAPDRSCEILGWEIGQVVIDTGRHLGAGTDKPCWILHKLRPLPLPELALEEEAA